MTARIQIPPNPRRGDIIDVRLLVQHAMETGYRYDDHGKLVPRNVITELTCAYGGREVFRARMSQGIAANPYLQFPLLVTDSGDIEISWVDDARVRGSEKRALQVRE